MNPPEQRSPELLDGLNPAQREAVTHGDGPLLVLAGAGSGKTRVITHRIAHLVRARGIHPARIVAVTFTNKAAAEMRERVARLLGMTALGGWIGTFHALCLRILRREGTRIGLEPGFNIYDSGDQVALVRRILKEETGDTTGGAPRSHLSRISRAKNNLESPEDLEQRAFTPDQKLLTRVYRLYNDALRRANAVDFDDLLLRTLELFREHPDVAGRYADQCEHLLVDEYQDTNRPQYLLVRALSGRHGNICVVGDEDQSIYRFRGAEIRNILEFEADHPGTTSIRLEQNYRSTGTILAAAGAVISNNKSRKGKTLWTENQRGDRVILFQAPDDRTEAAWVAERVRELEPATPYEGVAVLYRTNAQSRQLEEIFRRDRIPYQVVGSVKFYERKEVKDLLAYLKLAANRADDVAFRRIVNTPTRGIGNTSLRAVEDAARSVGQPLFEAAHRVVAERILAPRSAGKLEAFLALVEDLRVRAQNQPVAGLVEHVIESIGFEAHLKKSHLGEAEDRMDNVRALVSGAVEYEEEEESPSLEGFLDRSALVADADEVGARPGVTLMTIHCAKGLEFPVVFLVGLEENLFPHSMSSGSDEDIEEERRLCYVAMTRARQRLYLCFSLFRRVHGQFMPSLPSRFVDEVPVELIEEVKPPETLPGDVPRFRETFRPARASSGSSAARAAARRRAGAAPSFASAASEDPADGFAVGALVRHPTFGSGRIVGREGSGKHLKLTIHFSASGPKKILPSYTKLQVRSGQ